MINIIKEFRYSFRHLLRNRGFSLSVICTLALGIGTCTAIFSVINRVLLQPLPFPNQDRLMMIWERNVQARIERDTPAPANFLDWRDQAHSFQYMAAILPAGFTLNGDQPQRVDGMSVSPELFPALGVQPMLGVPFNVTRNAGEIENSVILSYALWKQSFGSDPNVIGRSIGLNDHAYRVTAVMPERFFFMSRDTQLWVPFEFSLGARKNRGNHFLQVLGLIRPNVTKQAAQSELSSIAHGLEMQYPETNTGVGVVLVSLREQLVGDVRFPLLMLLLAVGLLYLLACVNVASLLGSHSVSRRTEVALRSALGANSSDLRRLMTAESLLLTVSGGLLGFVVASVAVHWISRIVPPHLLELGDISVDFLVLFFAIALAVVTGLLLGLLPTIRQGTAINTFLNAAGRGDSRSIGTWFSQKLFVGSEVALVFMLLIAAGLLVHTFVSILSVPWGISEPEHLLTMRMALPRNQYDSLSNRAALYRNIFDRVNALPGVSSSAVISFLPLTMEGGTSSFRIEGQPTVRGEEPSAHVRLISADYFKTIGLPLLNGRLFTEHDNQTSECVIIVNQAMAKKFWSHLDAVGQRLNFGDPDDKKPWCRVAGVVGNVRDVSLTTAPEPEIYRPYLQEPEYVFVPQDLVIHSVSPTATLAQSVIREIHSVSSVVAVYNVRTMKELMNNSVMDRRFSMTLLLIFGGIGLVLSILGVYTLASFGVTQQKREIAIRMALGATSGQVLSFVVRQNMPRVLWGALAGLILSLLAADTMRSLLFGVSKLDLPTFVGTPLLLLTVALLACLIPASRAARIVPMDVLRQE